MVDVATLASNLSKADSMVLAQVFDPESAPTRAEVLIDPYLAADRHIKDVELRSKLRSQERHAIMLIEDCEKTGTAHPDRRHAAYQQALAILDNIVLEQPDYASARNNRAQLRRWRYGDRNTLCQRRGGAVADRGMAASSSINDLREAISLASPPSPHDAVSPSQGRLLGQAYTQLAALYYAASKDLVDRDFEVVSECVEGWDREALEEEGSRNFYLGGMYGNEVAKALAVHTNPHAKLCGSIVKEAMRKEFATAQV
ncbi:hypothetical protein K431DRAFT_338704 [Polychaeton citri CBS 116435]|uniref:Uncharacterized protein n=1 Tax=Polychaeton citri CBS 116435 TaxID=1314669 RepID=A0A9P4QAJ3_9PEZI|nr:hypothetical protein K431DRAFT_338704 [Polychaeton citri CBS 116435]